MRTDGSRSIGRLAWPPELGNRRSGCFGVLPDSPDALLAVLADQYAATVELINQLDRDYHAMVAASVDTNADDEHDPEGSTIGFERAQLASLIRDARQRIADVDLARARIVAGDYHRCEHCDGPIADERLAARPATRRCVHCARAL